MFTNCHSVQRALWCCYHCFTQYFDPFCVANLIPGCFLKICRNVIQVVSYDNNFYSFVVQAWNQTSKLPPLTLSSSFLAQKKSSTYPLFPDISSACTWKEIRIFFSMSSCFHYESMVQFQKLLMWCLFQIYTFKTSKINYTLEIKPYD